MSAVDVAVGQLTGPVSADATQNVETVSDWEVWQIDSYGNRIRRVCGAQKPGQPKGRLCMRVAGWKTVHQSMGRCYKHEPRGLAFARQYRAMSMEVGSLPPTHPFRRAVERTFERNQQIDLELPVEELKALYVVQNARIAHFHERRLLETDDTRVLNGALDQLKKDAEAIADMKERLHRMRLDRQVVTRDHLDMLMTHLQDMFVRLCPNEDILQLFIDELASIQFMADGVVTFSRQSELSADVRRSVNRSLPDVAEAVVAAEDSMFAEDDD